MVAVFGTLPEESFVVAEERCALHLRRMFEDAVALCTKLLWRHRHAHLDVLDFPFSPSSTIHPYAAVVNPFRSCLLFEVERCQNGIGTLAVSAVRVGKVARYVYLMRLNLLQQFAYYLHILLGHGQLLYLARLVEGQVEEVNLREWYAVVGACGASFASTDESFNLAYSLGVHIRRAFVLEELLDFGIHVLYYFVLAVAEYLVEAVDEVHEACHFFVAHSDVA